MPCSALASAVAACGATNAGDPGTCCGLKAQEQFFCYSNPFAPIMPNSYIVLQFADFTNSPPQVSTGSFSLSISLSGVGVSVVAGPIDAAGSVADAESAMNSALDSGGSTVHVKVSEMPQVPELVAGTTKVWVVEFMGYTGSSQAAVVGGSSTVSV